MLRVKERVLLWPSRREIFLTCHVTKQFWWRSNWKYDNINNYQNICVPLIALCWLTKEVIFFFVMWSIASLKLVRLRFNRHNKILDLFFFPVLDSCHVMEQICCDLAAAANCSLWRNCHRWSSSRSFLHFYKIASDLSGSFHFIYTLIQQSIIVICQKQIQTHS